MASTPPATWPPLPEPVSMVASSTDGFFTADQMRAYAEQYAAAMREAAPVQEPVAHICILPTGDAGPTKFFTSPSDPRGFPVYAAPVEPASQPREPLSREQVFNDDGIMAANGEKAFLQMDALMAIVGAVERAHGIGSPGATQT
jgi:hypothetical protein